MGAAHKRTWNIHMKYLPYLTITNMQTVQLFTSVIYILMM